MTSPISPRQESRSLQAILEPQMTVAAFFDSVWQVACAIFSPASDNKGITTADGASSTAAAWNEELVQENPYEELIRQGWDVLIDLLERARGEMEAEVDGSEPPLLFKDQSPLSPEERAIYNNSLFAAFLDGCSVVINHADHQSPWIAALCQDFQQSFPHAYVNCYLTPAASQTAPPHADDRDVLVIQVVGSKHWKVYQRIPVPYPYPHEQVGKDGLPVPETVLEGPVMIERTLHPGDVLYMPRGYVHEARAADNEPSFHITTALATHDWTLAGFLSTASQQIWTSQIPNRMAVSREFGMRDWKEINESEKLKLQSQIDEAIQSLQEQVTAETVHKALQFKYERHNQRAWASRKQLLEEAKNQQSSQPTEEDEDVNMAVIGREAASRVSLATLLRAATDEEKTSLPQTQQQQPRGLHVREENYDGIIQILQSLKSNPTIHCRVANLRSLQPDNDGSSPSGRICDLTLLSFARQCVELGALAVVPES